MRRGCSGIVSVKARPSPQPALERESLDPIRIQGTDADNVVVADHPARQTQTLLPLSLSSAYAPNSRITVTTTTAPTGSTVTSVTAPHSPLVAGTLLVQRNPIQAAHPSVGGKLRIIHSISKVGDKCSLVTQVHILP